MKLFKPDWISHDGQPIFSIDIHPDGSRFATGGLGDGGSSGKVIIWNMTPVENMKDEDSNDVPKVLCVMDNHLACVNSVRWSCNGRYLASGGDDRLIMIWQFAGYGGVGVFGGPANLSATNGERWRCTHTLKGHTGDVLDLAWSPANQWLASCSIDNSVIIWNAEKFPEVTTVLKGHSSLVKGVTWDPIGSYVASQSDDKTVKIWKTLDWKLETTVSKPFAECTATTHVLRLSWSPDGGYLVSAHAMNNSGPTAQIIQREGWTTDMDFVGHRKAITCTRFNGCVFSNPTTPEGKKSNSLPYTCCAVGSRDRSLSVWLTSLRRPLVVIHDLFENSVMDISWSFNGYNLLCCSWDGTVAYLSFDEPEIGKTLTQEQKNKLHKDTYGKTSCMAQQPLVIENPALLALQQKKADQGGMLLGDQTNKPPPIPHNYPTKQIETRTATGRRRIIPVFVAPQEALGGIPCPFGSNSAFGRPPSTSSLINSALKKSPEISEKSPAKSALLKEDTRSPSKHTTEKAAETIPEKQPDKQSPAKLVTAEAEQKKKAVLDSRLCEKSSDTSKGEILSPPDAQTRKVEQEKQAIPPPPALGSPHTKVQTPPQPSPRRPGRPPLHLKRKMNGSTSPVRKRQYKQMRKEHGKHIYPEGDNTTVHEQPTIRKEITPTHKTIHVSRHVDPHILPQKKLTRKLFYQSPSVPHLSVTIYNELTSDDKPIPSTLHKVECLCNKVEQWTTVISSPATCLAVSRYVVGLACHDHSIHALSLTSGRRLFPPIYFGLAISCLICRGHHLMVIDITCKISIWDTKNGKANVMDRTFAHLVDDSCHGNKDVSSLKKCFLTPRGLPIITLINGKTYSFSQDLGSWVLIQSTSDAVEQFSDTVAVETDEHSNDENALLFAKKSFNGMGAHASRSSHTSAMSQRNATLAMLESKVAACVVIESAIEYRRWMLAYVRYLVKENLELRLREVCNDLIGPPAQRSWSKMRNKDSGSWKAHVLGIQKQTLLQEEVLPIVASNLAFQRLYTEYQDQLDNQTMPTLPGLNGNN